MEISTSESNVFQVEYANADSDVEVESESPLELLDRVKRKQHQQQDKAATQTSIFKRITNNTSEKNELKNPNGKLRDFNRKSAKPSELSPSSSSVSLSSTSRSSSKPIVKPQHKKVNKGSTHLKQKTSVTSSLRLHRNPKIDQNSKHPTPLTAENNQRGQKGITSKFQRFLTSAREIQKKLANTLTSPLTHLRTLRTNENEEKISTSTAPTISNQLHSNNISTFQPDFISQTPVPQNPRKQASQSQPVVKRTRHISSNSNSHIIDSLNSMDSSSSLARGDEFSSISSISSARRSSFSKKYSHESDESGTFNYASDASYSASVRSHASARRFHSESSSYFQQRRETPISSDASSLTPDSDIGTPDWTPRLTKNNRRTESESSDLITPSFTPGSYRERRYSGCASVNSDSPLSRNTNPETSSLVSDNSCYDFPDLDANSDSFDNGEITAKATGFSKENTPSFIQPSAFYADADYQTVQCQRCESTAAALFCQPCQLYLCTENKCDHRIHLNPQLMNHKRRYLSETSITVTSEDDNVEDGSSYSTISNAKHHSTNRLRNFDSFSNASGELEPLDLGESDFLSDPEDELFPVHDGMSQHSDVDTASTISSACDETICAMCKQEPALLYCIDCRLQLCLARGCDAELHAGEFNFHHRIVSGGGNDPILPGTDHSIPAEDTGFCQLCQVNPAEVYCPQCNIYTCIGGRCDEELHALDVNEESESESIFNHTRLHVQDYTPYITAKRRKRNEAKLNNNPRIHNEFKSRTKQEIKAPSPGSESTRNSFESSESDAENIPDLTPTRFNDISRAEIESRVEPLIAPSSPVYRNEFVVISEMHREEIDHPHPKEELSPSPNLLTAAHNQAVENETIKNLMAEIQYLKSREKSFMNEKTELERHAKEVEESLRQESKARGELMHNANEKLHNAETEKKAMLNKLEEKLTQIKSTNEAEIEKLRSQVDRKTTELQNLHHRKVIDNEEEQLRRRTIRDENLRRAREKEHHRVQAEKIRVENLLKGLQDEKEERKQKRKEKRRLRKENISKLVVTAEEIHEQITKNGGVKNGSKAITASEITEAHRKEELKHKQIVHKITEERHRLQIARDHEFAALKSGLLKAREIRREGRETDQENQKIKTLVEKEKRKFFSTEAKKLKTRWEKEQNEINSRNQQHSANEERKRKQEESILQLQYNLEASRELARIRAAKRLKQIKKQRQLQRVYNKILQPIPEESEVIEYPNVRHAHAHTSGHPRPQIVVKKMVKQPEEIARYNAATPIYSDNIDTDNAWKNDFIYQEEIEEIHTPQIFHATPVVREVATNTHPSYELDKDLEVEENINTIDNNDFLDQPDLEAYPEDTKLNTKFTANEICEFRTDLVTPRKKYILEDSALSSEADNDAKYPENSIIDEAHEDSESNLGNQPITNLNMHELAVDECIQALSHIFANESPIKNTPKPAKTLSFKLPTPKSNMSHRRKQYSSSEDDYSTGSEEDHERSILENKRKSISKKSSDRKSAERSQRHQTHKVRNSTRSERNRLTKTRSHHSPSKTMLDNQLHKSKGRRDTENANKTTLETQFFLPRNAQQLNYFNQTSNEDNVFISRKKGFDPSTLDSSESIWKNRGDSELEWEEKMNDFSRSNEEILIANAKQDAITFEQRLAALRAEQTFQNQQRIEEAANLKREVIQKFERPRLQTNSQQPHHKEFYRHVDKRLGGIVPSTLQRIENEIISLKRRQQMLAFQ